MTRQLEDLIKHRRMLKKLFWYSGLLNAIVLGCWVYFVTQRIERGDVDEMAHLVFFFVLSIAAAFGALKLPEWLFQDKKIRSMLTSPPDLEAFKETGRGAPCVKAETIEKLQSLDESEQRVFVIISQSYMSSFVGLSCAEVPAVCGFFYSVLTDNMLYYIPFAAVSVVLVLLQDSGFGSLLQRIEDVSKRLCVGANLE